MHRHAARDPYADRGDLAIRAGRASAGSHTPLRPSTRPVTTPSSAQPRSARPRAGVRGRRRRPGRQRDDRIAGELPGPCQVILPPRSTSMTGVPSTGAPRLGTPARGVDGSVLEQQHGVVDRAGDPRRVQLALQRQAASYSSSPASRSAGPRLYANPVTQAELPVRLHPGPADGRDRIERWAALHDLSHPTVTRDVGRLELRYDPAPGVYDELVALAAAEQDCCGFVTWQVARDDDVPVLTVTAPAGDPTALDAITAVLPPGSSDRESNDVRRHHLGSRIRPTSRWRTARRASWGAAAPARCCGSTRRGCPI